MPDLVPDVIDEIRIQVAHTSAGPSFHVTAQRITNIEGSIALATPRVEVLDKSTQFLHIMELAKSMGYSVMIEPKGQILELKPR